MKEICEYCGKRQKRYRSAFSSWICDNCKKETDDYEYPGAFIKVQANEWWNFLSYKRRIEIYLKEKEKCKNKQLEKVSKEDK